MSPPVPPAPPVSPPSPPDVYPAAGPFSVCRFTVTANNGDSYMQVSEVSLRDEFRIEVGIGSATSDCSPIYNEAPQHAIDGNTATKWLCDNPTGALMLMLSSAARISAYELFTANDAPARDPTSWLLDCGTDGSSFMPLDSADGISPPTGRFASYGLMSVSQSLPAPPSQPASPPSPPSSPVPSLPP
eukprot:5518229-Prymnesium_polylepis.1